MFVLVVRFTVRPECLHDFDDLVGRTVALIRTEEPGTLTYAVHRRPESPEERVFYEVYQDREAFDSHENQPHTKEFLERRVAMLAGEPEVWWLE